MPGDDAVDQAAPYCVEQLGIGRPQLAAVGAQVVVDIPASDVPATDLDEGVAILMLALHPEAFTVFRDSRDADLFMLLTDPNYVTLCPNTAQFTVAGSDPLDIVRRHRDRVVLTHWKDAVGPAPEGVTIDDNIFQTQIQWFAPVGQGVVDWPGWARLLRDLRYTGWAVFELDGAVDPVADLTAIRTYVESSLGHLLA